MPDAVVLGFVILEDNDERRAAMRERLMDRFPQYSVSFFSTAAECVDHLQRHLPGVLAVSLDHDLELIPIGNGRTLEPGTGREVADFLAAQAPSCPILVHSTNAPASVAMIQELEDSGWPVYQVSPYGDLEWISERWFPTLREAMSSWTRTASVANVTVS